MTEKCEVEKERDRLKKELSEAQFALGSLRSIVGAHDGVGYKSIIEAAEEMSSRLMDLNGVRRALEGKNAVGDSDIALDVQKVVMELSSINYALEGKEELVDFDSAKKVLEIVKERDRFHDMAKRAVGEFTGASRLQIEYRVTNEELSYKGPVLSLEPDIETPDDEGWELVGMAANESHIFWTWKRVSVKEQ